MPFWQSFNFALALSDHKATCSSGGFFAACDDYAFNRRAVFDFLLKNQPICAMILNNDDNGGITMKRTLSISLALVLLFSVLSFSSYAKVTKISNVNDATNFILEQEELFVIRRATFSESGKAGRSVYLIALGGSDFSLDETHIQCLQNAVRSGCSMPNAYLSAVIAQANKDIPKGSEVLLIGHSFGGMIAQQFADDATMKANYTITNVLAMGSPYILDTAREGALHRMADSSDFVPYLSMATLLGMYSKNLSVETGGYVSGMMAHSLSYNTAACWQVYDALGVKGGTSTVSVL
ncbi:MAG TPA: hypothetical protein DDY98_05515 [Ruminococcaceae bacterium]|nr:hypothetical protein [Oscillospiraceae bacterium]